VHANKAVQNNVEENKIGGEVIMGEDISYRRGRLYYDRGETLLRSRGDFLMGETISRDTGMRSQLACQLLLQSMGSRRTAVYIRAHSVL